MIKKILFFITLFIFPIVCFANPLWHCTVSNVKNAVWNQYGATREAALFPIERQCFENNNHKSCETVCFPPRVYWRCLSHDTVPIIKNLKPNETQPKQGVWFWTSFSKQVAINGARDACRHNSAFGGCYVDPNACASS